MTELSDALATCGECAALDPVERAAAEKDLHLSTCVELSLEDCEDCRKRLGRIRRIVKAVRPVIEREHWERRCETAAADLSKLPGSPGTVTARRLAWYFAARAQARLCSDDEFGPREARAFAGEFAAASALRRLAAGDGDDPDAVAQEICRALLAGELAGEQLAEWLREWRAEEHEPEVDGG